MTSADRSVGFPNSAKAIPHATDWAASLSELGEREILESVIIPRLSAAKAVFTGIGDDCAELSSAILDEILLITTDPCPTPVVFELGDRDYWHYGWMTVLINISDLAAMGGTPTGIVVSTVMPEELSVQDYDRFLEGLTAAADLWMCPVLGGNIKDGREFTATGTAIGTVSAERVMRRAGARPGDLIYAAGTMGLFWASVLALLRSQWDALSAPTRDQLHDALHRPVARLREGQLLAGLGVVSSCMDASDGVSACLTEMAKVNSVDFVVESDLLVPHPAVLEVSRCVGIDFRKLMLSWGNWELVFTARPGGRDLIAELAEAQGLPIQQIGHVREGGGVVRLAEDRRLHAVTDFSSQRFAKTSYFTHGIGSFADWLTDASLAEGIDP